MGNNTCDVCNINVGRIVNSKKYHGFYCIKHYTQLKKYNKTLDINQRKKTDLNEIIQYGNYAEIVLYKNNIPFNKAIIDIESISSVNKYKWRITSVGYVEGRVNNKTVLLHRFLTVCPDDKVVDHINHNPLDNRISNLRICSQQQNSFNSSMFSHNTSGYKGVSWDKRKNKWRSHITVHNKYYHLGYFKEIRWAIKARKEAEEFYFKMPKSIKGKL